MRVGSLRVAPSIRPATLRTATAFTIHRCVFACRAAAVPLRPQQNRLSVPAATTRLAASVTPSAAGASVWVKV